MNRAILLTLALVITPISAMASQETTTQNQKPDETPAVCTALFDIVDRPSVSNSTCTVGQNRIVLESGYINIITPGSPNLASYPNAFIRIGANLKNLEFNLSSPTYNKSAGFGGMSDLGVGLKYRLGTYHGVQGALEADITVPTGSALYSANGTNVSGTADLGYSVGAIGIGVSAKFTSNSNGMVKYGSFEPSIELSTVLLKGTQIFIEASQIAGGTGVTSRLVDYGLQHQISPKAIVDVSYGIQRHTGLSDYRYMGFGLTYAP